MPPTLDQILDVSTELFANHGFGGTSLQDIAGKVGVQKPTLLYHFSSKEDLREQVLQRLLVQWRATVPKLLQAANSGDQRFDAVVTCLTEFLLERPARAKVLLREALDRPEVMRALLAAHVRPWLSLVAEDVRRGQQAKALRADVPAELYAFHVMVTVLTSVASLDVLRGAVPLSQGKGLQERYLAEVLRVVRTALFID